jgi:5'-methylthioadenosine phosphorylase
VLARELAVCYTAIAMVTDLDAGLEAGSGVTQEEVFAVFEDNLHRLRDLLMDVVGALPASADRDCACARALEGTAVGPEPQRPDTRR